MTVIAVMRDGDDALLLAADSGETDPSTGLRSISPNKLHMHSTAPFAWAATGLATTDADRLHASLAGIAWPPHDHTALEMAIRELVARANKTTRESIAASGRDPSKDESICVLVGAWVGEAPFMFEVDENGLAESYTARGFWATGGGAAAVRIAMAGVNAYSAAVPAEHRLIAAMTIGTKVSPGCDLPVKMARVRRNGRRTHLVLKPDGNFAEEEAGGDQSVPQ